MEVSKTLKHRNLTKTERIMIAQWINIGRSNKWIADELDRPMFTIGREINRNSFCGKVYESMHAHGKVVRRRLGTFKVKHPLENEKVLVLPSIESKKFTQQS